MNFNKLPTTPRKIQDLLDSLSYSADPITRSAKAALKARKAHCFDGALIAAYCLEKIGDPPLIIDFRSDGRDDDHVIAVFKRAGHYGAIAKSNFVGLRYREPIYRSLRELALSYFNSYINLKKERTLLEYSLPLKLKNITNPDWRFADKDTDLGILSDRLDTLKHYRIYPPKLKKHISLADKRLLEGEIVGINLKGVYKT